MEGKEGSQTSDSNTIDIIEIHQLLAVCDFIKTGSVLDFEDGVSTRITCRTVGMNFG